MQWALRRQFLYALGVLLVIGVIGLGVWFVFFYHAPSCTDGIQNQDELGIDCDGVCKKLCTAPRVSALFARAVEVAPGVYHAVALVRNPETNAGTQSLPYHFSLYDDQGILIAERRGNMYLNPGEVAPLFEADIVTGSRIPAHTAVEFGQAVWEKMSQVVSPISITSQQLDSDNLRLTAHIKNTTALPVPPTLVTALLYDAAGNVVNASQTLVSGLSAREEKDIVFTWQLPFANPVVRVEITPRVQ